MSISGNKFKRSIVTATALLMGIYGCTIAIKPGLLTTILSTIPLLGIAATALARVNDIGQGKNSKRWQARRVGLTMAGIGALALCATPIMGLDGPPPWKDVIFEWGIMLTWLTTPHMPPWWRWISRKDHNDEFTKNDLT